MLSVYRTLSVRYLSRRWFRALLIVASIALGVATLVATQSLNDTMLTATLARVNPTPGVADFVVSNSQLLISSDLANDIKKIPGVKDAAPRIFGDVRISELDNRSVLVIGTEKREHEKSESLVELSLDQDLVDVLKHAQAVLARQFKSDPEFGVEMRETLRRLLDKDSGKMVLDYLDRLEAGKETNEAAFDMVQRFLPPVMVGKDLMDALQAAAAKRNARVEELYQALDLKDDFAGTLAKQLIELDTDKKDYTLKVFANLPPEYKKDWLKGSDVKLANLAAEFKKDPNRLWMDVTVLWRLSNEFKEDALKVLSHRFTVQKSSQAPAFSLLRVGRVTATGHAAALGGNTLFMEIHDAQQILGFAAGKVSRIDVAVDPAADKSEIRKALEQAARGKGVVQTPEEHNEAMSSALDGMRTGFTLCGLAALVVGLFLVYNALSVSVAERRHEIGILLSLGATQRQVRLLFAGEAAVLGFVGSLLGIPLGIGLAYLALQPAQDLLKDLFVEIKADQVNVSLWLLFLAMLCGVLTSLFAGLMPAVAASRENPASAVRQVSKAPTWSNLSWHVFSSLALMIGGVLCILFRENIRHLQEELTGARLATQANRLGTYSGMILFLLGALLAAPLLAAVIARTIQPIARRFFPITWRLAADNLVLSPGRTGLVIAALAAGVALVLQTYGVTVSNQVALRDWVQESFAADLIVTSGSPIGAGDAEEMKESVGDKIARVDGVEAVLPMRVRKVFYNNGEVKLFALDAKRSYDMERKRQKEPQYLDYYKTLSEDPKAIIVSENFSAMHGVGKGDKITLQTGGKGDVSFWIVGIMSDYTWNRGTIFIDRGRYQQLFSDSNVDMFDVYVARASHMTDSEYEERVADVQDTLRRRVGENGLVVQTRKEFQDRILDMIDKLYAFAVGQLAVVMLIAALGVVVALLISVLQRRREMGLLRAIGASQNQVVRSVLAEACLMGVIGTIIGILVGIPLQWYILRVVIFEESGYLFPMKIPWLYGVFIAGAAMAIATLAGLWPALYSVRMRIPEAIAYE